MRNVMNALRARVSSVGVPLDVGGKNIIAFSGGVDSSLVACLVHQVFPQNSLACIGVSAALPAAQLKLARDVANHIGIPLTEVVTGEGSDPGYIANEGQSCFHCKSHLYSSLEAVAEQAGAESRGEEDTSAATAAAAQICSNGGNSRRRKVVLFNGINKDDKRDPTRVGLKAAADFQVASPIDILTKAEVRAVSRELRLPNWNHAASPCLRSRLAFGVQATPERLAIVEKAEEVARHLLDLGVSHNLRVRAMHGEKALLELLPRAGKAYVADLCVVWMVDDGETLEKAMRALPDIRRLILPLGFGEVNVRAFRSGALSGGGDVGTGMVSSVANAGHVEMSRVVGTGHKAV